MAKDNIIQKKSYAFALKIIGLYQELKDSKNYELASQILRSGTSIGANVEEALGGQSRRDFASKLHISYKEARETRYWLNLLTDSSILNSSITKPLKSDCEEILKILSSILTTTKSNESG